MLFVAGFFRTIILLGAVQGFILGSLLFFSKKNKCSNRLLAVLIFLIALASLKLYGAQGGWFKIPLLHLVNTFVPMIIVMPVGPLIFLYIKSFLHPEFHLTRKDRIHFYPVIIDLVPQLTAIIFFTGVLTGNFKNDPHPWGHFIDSYNVYSDIPRWISISLYTWMSARNLSALKKTQRGAADQDAASFKWLQQFIRLFLFFQALWLVYLIPYVIPRYTDALLERVDWYPVYVPLAILIYWMGFKGYLMSQQEFSAKKSLERLPSLPASVAEQVISSLKAAMEKDKLYLNQKLTVAILAAHAGVTQKNISAVLNQHLHKSFSEFVNEYRIEAMKERLLNGEIKNLTIAGMAYECGFNSIPTFQRAFKTIIGQTPKEFLSKQP